MTVQSSYYYILIFTKKLLILLLTLPLQTLMLIKSHRSIDLMILTADILVFSAIVTCGFIARNRFTLTENPNNYEISKGLFVTRKHHFQKRSIHCISVTQTIIQKLMRVYKITLTSSKSTAWIILGKKALHNFSFHQKESIENAPVFRSRNTDILLMSADFYASLTAALTLVPFIRSISILINTTPHTLFHNVSLWEALGYHNLPPLLDTISSALLLGWFAGFVLTFINFHHLRYYDFSSALFIHRGLLTKSHTTIPKESISATLIKQNLLMLLTGRYTAELVISHESRCPHLTIGCYRKKSLRTSLALSGFLPTHKHYRKIRPAPSACKSYVFLPFSLLVILSLCIILTDKLSACHIEPHLGIFLCLWCIVWFFHRFLSFFFSGLYEQKNRIILRTSKGLSLTEVIIPYKSLRAMGITQNIVQKHKGTCNLKIFIKNKKRKVFTLRHISIKKAAELTKKFCGFNFI